MAITSRSGTFNANTVSSTPSIVSLGKMAVNDQLTLQFSLSGCNNAQYSLTGSLLSNTSQVSGDVSTSFGMTVDGPYQPFSQYVGFNAMYGLDSGSTIGLSVAISTTSCVTLAPSLLSVCCAPSSFSLLFIFFCSFTPPLVSCCFFQFSQGGG